MSNVNLFILLKQTELLQAPLTGVYVGKRGLWGYMSTLNRTFNWSNGYGN